MSTAVAELVEPPNGASRDWTAEMRKMRGDYRLFAPNRCAVCGGPLFDDDEEEDEEDKKKKGKKEKTKTNKEDNDAEATQKKKKKGMFRLLHRGKDKAGSLLDGLQYEGDELQRKKAKRQLKRNEREGKLPSSTSSSTTDSPPSKKGSMERVVSEGRLGGADRRGRTKPNRARTMSSIPSAAASARVICRHCERGEKRRSWGAVRAEALAAGAPAHRLYVELSEERELMASLLARFDYLVASVSPDVGDLLIELFAPQLKEDTDNEQLRLVMAETREDNDDDNNKNRGDDDDDDDDDHDNKKKATTTKKKKKSRIMGMTTTTTNAGSGADKDGPSAKPMGLSLGKIFGWNENKNVAEGAAAGKAKGENGGANLAKPKRKVMALLPSCYCPIKKADKYETFFPTFYLEVYKAAEELQKELTMTADTYKAALKLFARLKATVQTGRQERLVSNMKIAFVEFIQEKQPELNWLKVKLQSMFVCQASYVFLVMCQLLWEIRKRQSLWLKLGKYCLATIQVMQGELSSLVISFHKDWTEHKQRIEEIITEYNKLKAEKNKALTSGSENTNLEDEELLLNCERIVRECVKQVEFNLGEIGLRATKEALVELVANLVLERAKCHI